MRSTGAGGTVGGMVGVHKVFAREHEDVATAKLLMFMSALSRRIMRGEVIMGKIPNKELKRADQQATRSKRDVEPPRFHVRRLIGRGPTYGIASSSSGVIYGEMGRESAARYARMFRIEG